MITQESLSKKIQTMSEKKNEAVLRMIDIVKQSGIYFYVKNLENFLRKNKRATFTEKQNFLENMVRDLGKTKTVIKESFDGDYKRCWCHGKDKMCAKCKGVGYEHG